MSPAAPIKQSLHFKVERVSASDTPYFLKALFLSDSKYSNPPLAILSHGSPVNADERSKEVPEKMQVRAGELVKLGFAVLIVERRGYGRSQEKYVEGFSQCADRDYIKSGQLAAADILGGIRFAKANLKMDPENIILVGYSAGGFSSIFASQSAEAGIKAVLNFSGGRGARGQRVVCSEEALLKAFATAGEKSRIPTLWVYSENDQLFSPEFATSMYKAFTKSGGNAEFLMQPPFQTNGHSLFSADGISIWLPLAKSFLKKIRICPLCE
ncbi:MAG: alpha/beta hydrolase family protein [Pseudobdellovibrionaceae bacterium]